MVVFLFFSSWRLEAQQPGPGASEMQDRAQAVLWTRAVPAMESALRSGGLTSEQARIVDLLLGEQRRIMLLFLNGSLLTGGELQNKLQEVFDMTREKIDIAVPAEKGD